MEFDYKTEIQRHIEMTVNAIRFEIEKKEKAIEEFKAKAQEIEFKQTIERFEQEIEAYEAEIAFITKS